MPGPGHALSRSLAAMTIGVVKGQDERDRLLSPTRLSELTQHLVADVSGKVSSWPVTQVVSVKWPYPFIYAPGQRDSFSEDPHFNFGLEISDESDVILFPTIRSWDKDADGMTNGARLAVKAWVPGARKMQDFRAKIHLTFWGYGAPVDEEFEEA